MTGLGLRRAAIGRESLCDMLARNLGPEWDYAQDEARAVAAGRARITEARQREANALTRSLAREGARRRFFTGMRTGLPPPAVPTSALWQSLPPELRGVVVQRLLDSNPASVIGLYESGLEGAAAVAGERHPFVTTSRPGGPLTEIRIPAVDYARLASAFGETDPLRLFLAMALCALRSYAEWRFGGGAVMRTAHGPLSLTASVDAALGGSLTDQVRQWYAWDSAPAPPPPDLPVSQAFASLYKWGGAAPLAPDPALLALAHDWAVPVARADAIHQPPMDAGMVPVAFIDMAAMFKLTDDNDMRRDIQAWMLRRGNANVDRVRHLLMTPAAVEAIIDLVDGTTRGVTTTRACASAVASSPYFVSTRNLWTGPLYLMPGKKGATLWGRFASVPIEQALDIACQRS